MLARNLFADEYNKEAQQLVATAHQVVWNQNYESFVPSDAEQHLCIGCLVPIPIYQSSNFCGPNCSGLGLGARIKSLSVNMGLSYLFPMSSLVKQSRTTPFAFQTIMMFLYDNHFGVSDVLTMWDKISADFVYRNPKLLKR